MWRTSSSNQQIGICEFQRGFSHRVHRDMENNEITEKIIGCAIEVHRTLGPGLLESVYESALCIELEREELRFQKQKQLPVYYKECQIGNFRLDFLVEDRVVIELKSVERFESVFEAQILGYMRLGKFKVGLLINFNSSLLKNGIKRFVL